MSSRFLAPLLPNRKTPLRLALTTGTAVVALAGCGGGGGNAGTGIARVDANGNGVWTSAATAAADAAIAKVQMNSAPALSADAQTLYVAVNADVGAGQIQGDYLLALNSTTLAVKSRVLLLNPMSGTIARVSDNSTASPAVGPDGDVYFGVLESTFGAHNAPSIVPAAMVPSYAGASSSLLMTKYNNYRGVGTGNGVNQLAVIDPHATQIDPISGRTIMKEILTIAGSTLEAGSAIAVKEWCINTAAVDPPRKSILVNSEDGYLYRWISRPTS